MKNISYYVLALSSGHLMAVSTQAIAADPNVGQLEAVQIIGSNNEAEKLPGSGAVVDEHLQETITLDVNQALKSVPGLYIREEDGNGLRPNIGIRGATSERSEKITLMEDNILIAPAPYSNPAAYYFPTVMRMSAIEIIKGAPLLRHGPQTTGGVVNLVSTPFPETAGGSLTTLINDRGANDIHAHYGENNDGFLWQLETVQRNSSGFKDIDRSNRDSGHDISDYLVKFGWQGERQRIVFKGQYSEETSNETYLGLADQDFNTDPNRRYGLSSIDQMANRHSSMNIFHTMQWSDAITQSTQVYYNKFNRDWFKLSGGGSFIDDANAGDQVAQGILDGTNDTTDLDYKHNNRAYISQGIATHFEFVLGQHIVQTGVRVHKDEMDRYQPIEVYDQINGSLVFQSETLPIGGDNRLEEAEATSLWLADDWQVSERLNTQLTLRYEDVESSRIQYADPDRATLDETRSNSTQELLPGASFTFDLNDTWQVLAGAHKGFSPLGGGATREEEPETSDNYEAGLRYIADEIFLEAIGFYSDFSNKAENCSVGSPCTNGDTSGRFVTGAAEISGLELQARKAFQLDNYTIPLQLAYTFTNAEISENNASFTQGDELKDIPENILSLQVGYEQASGWNSYAVAKYQDSMCVTTGCNSTNSLETTEPLVTLDLISHIPLKRDVKFIVKAENVFDEQKIVSRTPDGARPNKPVTLSMGMKVDF